MNIDDVKDVPKSLTIEDVFDEQRKLSEKYQLIEGRSHAINLDTKEGQQVVKDFLWRIVEEVGEALDSDLGESHIKEELADAFHFLVELGIISLREQAVKEAILNRSIESWGLNPPRLEELMIHAARVGRTCKNKPWKQTQIPIDQYSFTLALSMLTVQFMGYCSIWFNNNQELYQYYFRKSKVNEFRQRSGY